MLPKEPALALLSLAVLTVAACGTTPQEEAAPATGPAVDDPPADLVASCGSVELGPPDPDWTYVEPVDDVALTAIAEVAEEIGGAMGLDFVDRYDWLLVEHTEDVLRAVGLGPAEAPAPADAYASLRREDGQWRLDNGGQCRVLVSASGFSAASFDLDQADPPATTSSELTVLAVEWACANGRAPVNREVRPVVHETEASVAITVLVEPVTGGATCPGNPPFPVTVELDQPLGDRDVLDASTVPAAAPGAMLPY